MNKGLNAREKVVLEYIKSGKNMREIAQIMFVSYHTVKAMIHAIKRKLDNKY